MQARQGARSASVAELREDRFREIVPEALKPLEARMDSLEAKVDALLKHFGIQLPG